MRCTDEMAMSLRFLPVIRVLRCCYIMLLMRILGDSVRGSPLILDIHVVSRPLDDDDDIDEISASAQSYV